MNVKQKYDAKVRLDLLGLLKFLDNDKAGNYISLRLLHKNLKALSKEVKKDLESTCLECDEFPKELNEDGLCEDCLDEIRLEHVRNDEELMREEVKNELG